MQEARSEGSLQVRTHPKRILMRVKNARPAEMKKGAVYEIPSKDCSEVSVHRGNGTEPDGESKEHIHCEETR